MALIPWFSGGGGPGVIRIIHIIFGSLVGALIGGIIAAVFDEPPKALSQFALDGCIIGGWLGWCFDGGSESGRAAVRVTRLGERYPPWFVTLFTASLVGLIIGFISAIYIVLVGFSTIALAGTYLIPLGLMALYYLLGAAEQRSF
jgi:uncharacterized membrane protein